MTTLFLLGNKATDSLFKNDFIVKGNETRNRANRVSETGKAKDQGEILKNDLKVDGEKRKGGKSVFKEAIDDEGGGKKEQKPLKRLRRNNAPSDSDGGKIDYGVVGTKDGTVRERVEWRSRILSRRSKYNIYFKS